MGINTILNYRSPELMNARYVASEAKNNTDALTQGNKGLNSSHGRYACQVRNYNDDKELAGLIADDGWAHCKDIN